jgi:hypothetical protein
MTEKLITVAMDHDASYRNTTGTDGEGIRLGGYVAMGLGKVDLGGRSVENARACGGVVAQGAHVQSGMESLVAGLGWAPAADPKRVVRDWDYGSVSGRCSVSLASTVLQEMCHDAEGGPATDPVAPPVRGGYCAFSPVPRDNGLETGSASARTMSRHCQIVGRVCSTVGLVLTLQ